MTSAKRYDISLEVPKLMFGPGSILLALGILEGGVSVSLPFLASTLYQRSARTMDLPFGKQILAVIVLMVLVASLCNLLTRMLTSHLRGKVLRNLRIAGFHTYVRAVQSELQKKIQGISSSVSSEIPRSSVECGQNSPASSTIP